VRFDSDDGEGQFDDADPAERARRAADADADRRVLGWGSSANPNTADGQIQAMNAFAAAAVNAKGWRRTVARIAAWVVLLLIAGYVLLVFGLAAKIV
jgi:hypothetical protein